METIKNNIMNMLNDEIEIIKIDNLNNNTSNIYEIYNNRLKINYICKIFDIKRNDTKKVLGEKEFYFYDNLIDNFKNIINIPIFYGFIRNNNNEIYELLLQKLNKINYFNIDTINIIINNISKLHIFYWNNFNKINLLEQNKEVFTGIQVKENIVMKVKNEAKYYFYNIPNIFEEKIYNIFNQLLSIKIEELNENNKTIIHGSLKIENIILVNENNKVIPYFIDWGLYKIGYGVEDILFLLIFSLNEELFKNNYHNILENYFNIINKSNQYNYDDFINHIKISLLDFILCAIIGLFIKNHFSKIKNNKLNIYLNNYLYIINKYNNMK